MNAFKNNRKDTRGASLSVIPVSSLLIFHKCLPDVAEMKFAIFLSYLNFKMEGSPC